MRENSDVISAMRSAIQMKMAGNFTGARRVLASALSTVATHDVDALSELLAFDADLCVDMGSYLEAERQYGEARARAEHLPYRRYTIELALGGLCERTQREVDAVRWYTSAIHTAMNDATTSAAAAVLRLARLIPLRGDLLTLCERALEHSRRVLGMRPDASDDVEAAAQAIIEAQGHRRGP